MAKIDKLAPIISKWEGGYVNHINDKGGATNMGVTLETWKKLGYDKNNDGVINAEDIKMLTVKDFEAVLRVYWDIWKADHIVNQSVANILVDWVWGSGSWGVKIPQRILGVAQDGKVGTNTLGALNKSNQKELFDKIFAERKKFLENIVAKNPSQKVFLKGWMSRLNDFKFSE